MLISFFLESFNNYNTSEFSETIINGYIFYKIFIIILIVSIIISYFIMIKNVSDIKKILKDIRINEEEISSNTNGLVKLEVKKAKYNQNK